MSDEKDLSMINNEDFYILGMPIKTKIGDCHFLKVKDYPNYSIDLNIVSMTKLHFVHAYRKNDEDEKVLQHLESLSLLSIIVNYLPDVFKSYERVFAHFFKDEDAIHNISSEEEFEEYRQLILKLSCIKEEKINPNPEIQEFIDKSKKVKAQQNSGITFSTIVTSVSALGGKDYENIREMTLFQLYMEFYRIAQKVNYETSVLFATVAEKVEIEDWAKKISLFEEEKHGLTRSEFSKIAGTISD